MPSIKSLAIDEVSLWDGNNWQNTKGAPKGHDLHEIPPASNVKIGCTIGGEGISIQATRVGVYGAILLTLRISDRAVISGFRLF